MHSRDPTHERMDEPQLAMPMPSWQEPMKRCVGPCGEDYPLDWFPVKRRTGWGMYTSPRVPWCKACWQYERDKRKYLNRFLIKVRNTRRTHAVRLTKILGQVFTTTILERVYGWELDVMATDAEHAYAGACGHCHIHYKAMPNGLGSMTLDIRDRAAEPVYGANTDWMCETGNRQKGILTMAEWSREQMLWRRWRQAMGHKVIWPPPEQMQRTAQGAQLVLGGTIWH